MLILGIDIGGTKTSVLLGDEHGRTRARRAFPTEPHRGIRDFLERLEREGEGVLKEAGADHVDCASIACGGPLDEEQGVLLGPPHLAEWRGVMLSDEVSAILELPAYLMHDARASVFAEWKFGAGDGCSVRNMAHMTFATGFGMGAVIDGRLMRIPGEIGHWRVAWAGPYLFGKTGSLEGLASGAGLAALARLTGEFDADIDVRELARLARDGDDVAHSILRSGARQVGIQCARLIDQLGVELITLGTIAVQCEDLVMDTIRRVAKDEALPHLAERCTITPAGLGTRLGDVACLSAALCYHKPAAPQAAGGAAADQLRRLADVAAQSAADAEFTTSVDEAARRVTMALKAGSKILTCGNGGSATDAAHLAEELVGRYKGDRPSVPAISLATDGSVLTCIANDYGFEEVFARQVDGLGQTGDVLVAFTTSGNSENINRALTRATGRGIYTIAVVGKSGGDAAQLADLVVHVKSDATERIQEIHTFVLHAICEEVEQGFSS